MKKAIFIIVTLLLNNIAFSQCECTDCPIHIASNTSETSHLDISGGSNPTLGTNGQVLCQVCIDIFTDAIQEIDVILTSPNGSSVILSEHSGLSIDNNINFKICFVMCSAFPNPDPGHNPIFTSDDSWGSGTDYFGSYHPFSGCLEDFTGSVNGEWTLEIEDFTFNDDTDLNNWYLVFADDDGLDCTHAGECGDICLADAGIVTITNTPACPSETVSFLITEYNTSSLYSEYILITDQNGEILEVFEGDQYDFTYDYCDTFQVFSYNLETAGTATIPDIGDNVFDYNCTGICCDLVGEAFYFIDDEPPVFTFVPEHPNYPDGDPFTEIYCLDDVPQAEQAHYNDNCIDEGSLYPIDTDLTEECTGGSYFRKWEISDSCNPTVVIEQEIIVSPPPIPEFVDPPSDYTVECDEVPPGADNLFYTNNLNNNCLLEGEASPFIEKDYDICGGTITIIWNDYDGCDNELEYIQTITVNQAEDPVFMNIPPDTTLACGNNSYNPPDLMYTNNASGDCLIEGLVEGQMTQIGQQIIVEWKMDTLCFDIQATQIITLKEGSVLELELKDTVICFGDSFNLASVSYIDTNSTEASISYHYATPPDFLNILNDSIVFPIDTAVYYFLLTTEDGCMDFDSFIINVVFPIQAANDGEGTVCNDNTFYSLFDFLIDVNITTGTWFDTDDSQIDLSDPFKVDFNGLNPGKYDFTYVVHSLNSCNPDTAIATVNVIESLHILIDSVICSPDTLFYSIFIRGSNSTTLTINSGELSDLGSGEFRIVKIPLTDTLIIAALDSVTTCEMLLEIAPPDCSCPHIDAPINNGDREVCMYELPLILSVTVGENQTASWYTSSSGGSPIASNTLSYSPEDTLPGIYRYYVEAIDLNTDACVSLERTEIIITILPSPFAEDITISTCEKYEEGKVKFSLSTIKEKLVIDTLLSVSYFETESDAINETTQLSDFIIDSEGINQIIYARVTNDAGCFIIVEVELSINAVPNSMIYVNPSNVLDCSVQQVRLSSENEKNTSYLWIVDSNPVSSDELILDHKSEVILIAIDTISGCQSRDTVNILDLEAYPKVKIEEVDTLDCNHTSIVIDGSESQSGSEYKYKWYGDNLSNLIIENQNIITVSSGGWYFLGVTNTEIGCTNIDSVFVEERDEWNVILPIEIEYTEKEDIILQAEIDIDMSEVLEIEWAPTDNLSCSDCLNPLLLSPDISIYTITVTDIYGCESMASINILYVDKIEIYVPNIFSPDGDGINDYFYMIFPPEVKLSNLEISVFDRWGEMVYSKSQLHLSDKTSFWDGTFRGESLNSGVYIYMYKVEFANGEIIKGLGDITLIR